GFAVMLIGFLLLTQMSVDTTMWGIAWRMFIVGIGMGPALPLLNLAIQNAVPFTQIGAATAGRQFFQQLGQALGGAIFGVVLSTSLTAQLNANLAPVTAALPSALQAELSPERFRNSSSVTEGSGGSQVDLGVALAAATQQHFAEERKAVQA